MGWCAWAGWADLAGWADGGQGGLGVVGSMRRATHVRLLAEVVVVVGAECGRVPVRGGSVLLFGTHPHTNPKDEQVTGP